MILVDTSVWIDHLRHGNARLKSLLHAGQVLTHPFVLGELACGNLTDRQMILELLQALPQSIVATHDEVMAFVEQHSLHGKGLGLIDVHLLAASLLSRTALWSYDKPLVRAATALGIATQ
jgi:predicted nucleic acid-binding protein